MPSSTRRAGSASTRRAATRAGIGDRLATTNTASGNVSLINTAGTLTEAANAVLKYGALRVIAVATYGVLSGPAIERIEKSNIDKVIVTDTIPLSDAAKSCKKIEQVSIAPLLAEAISRIHNYDSVSSLFT